jgi:hypothetical protein
MYGGDGTSISKRWDVTIVNNRGGQQCVVRDLGVPEALRRKRVNSAGPEGPNGDSKRCNEFSIRARGPSSSAVKRRCSKFSVGPEGPSRSTAKMRCSKFSAGPKGPSRGITKRKCSKFSAGSKGPCSGSTKRSEFSNGPEGDT